jgi:hypothetical protein
MAIEVTRLSRACARANAGRPATSTGAASTPRASSIKHQLRVKCQLRGVIRELFSPPMTTSTRRFNCRPPDSELLATLYALP